MTPARDPKQAWRARSVEEQLWEPGEEPGKGPGEEPAEEPGEEPGDEHQKSGTSRHCSHSIILSGFGAPLQPQQHLGAKAKTMLLGPWVWRSPPSRRCSQATCFLDFERHFSHSNIFREHEPRILDLPLPVPLFRQNPIEQALFEEYCKALFEVLQT